MTGERGVRERVPLVPFLIALPALVASAVLPGGAGVAAALLAVVVLGVPHGALDVEIGRTLLRPRFRRTWFPVFAAPYLFLVALVLLAWRAAPEAALTGFLLLSVWHFGREDVGPEDVKLGGLSALARGGLPIAVPVLAWPDGTARLLSAIAGAPLGGMPGWLTAASVAWLLPAALWAAGEVRRGRARGLLLPGGLCAAFVLLPPLTAFTLYFVGVHAPAHTAALVRHPTRAPRADSIGAAWRLAVPATALTVLIGAGLWWFTPGPWPVRLLCATFQLLAALTVPHMMLEAWLDRRDQASSVARATARRASSVRASAIPVMAAGAQWRWNARSNTSIGRSVR